MKKLLLILSLTTIVVFTLPIDTNANDPRPLPPGGSSVSYE